jgi:thiol-disulfide isomerase/thioredoxin
MVLQLWQFHWMEELCRIFFIFKGSCPYCHKYSPVLKSFQNKYGITIMAISLDGGALPDFLYLQGELSLLSQILTSAEIFSE